MQNNGFLIHSKPIAIAISLTNWAAWKFLAATTAVFSYAMLGEFLQGYFDGAGFYAALAIGTAMVYLLVDAGLTKMLQWAFRADMSLLNGHGKKFSNFVIILIIFKVCATMTSSLWAAPEMADAITDNDGERQAVTLLLATDSVQTATLRSAEKRLQGLEASEADRIGAARAEGKRLVAEAVSMGNKWQRSSYRRIGFSWLLSPSNPDKKDHDYAKRIQKAQGTAAQLLEAEREKTATAHRNLLTISGDTSHGRTTALLADIATAERKDYTERKSRRKGYIWLADILATVLGLFCSYLLALRERAGGKPVGGKNIGSILGAFMDKKTEDFMAFLENILGVDIDGNGEVGTVGETSETVVSNNVKQPVETTPVATAEDRKTIGYKMPETTVKQLFHENRAVVSNNVKQPGETSETVEITPADVRYWKQRLKQSFRRKFTQDDPTTPKINFENFKGKLERIGYTIKEKNGKLEIIEPGL